MNNGKGLIKFEVNLSDTFDEFLISRKQARAMTEKALSDVTNAFMINWRAQAKLALKSTRSQYIKGIQRIDKGKLEKAVVLIGSLNNMLEMGANPFDIKKGFEKSSKKKMKVGGGWYLTVPFRWAAPDSIAESSIFAGIMPKEVHDLAKKLNANSTDSSGKTVKKGNGIKFEDLPQSLQSTGTRQEVGSFKSYTHKNSIYEGIQRNEKTYEGATQNTFTSFRRVSDKSDPMSWIHSGIKAYDLANRAMNQTNFNTVLENSVDQFLSENKIKSK